MVITFGFRTKIYESSFIPCLLVNEKYVGLFSLKCACVLPLNITGSINKIALWMPQRIAWGEETDEIIWEGVSIKHQVCSWSIGNGRPS